MTRDVGVHADPGGRIFPIAEDGVELLQALRRVGLEHPLELEHHEAGGGDPPHHVGLRVRFLGEELGGDDAGRVAHPLDLDIGMILVEAGGVLLEVVGLDGRVDRQRRLRGSDARRREPDRRRDDGTAQQQPHQRPLRHRSLPALSRGRDSSPDHFLPHSLRRPGGAGRADQSVRPRGAVLLRAGSCSWGRALRPLCRPPTRPVRGLSMVRSCLGLASRQTRWSRRRELMASISITMATVTSNTVEAAG